MSKKLKELENHGGAALKCWKKIKQESKLLKKKRRQEKLIKELERTKKLQETLNSAKIFNATSNTTQSLSTISIAVPGSILENAQSPELRTYLAGQIARAACIFRVNEIVVFDDTATQRTVKLSNSTESDTAIDSYEIPRSCIQLARILQYLECPQYLRKFFFPLHNDLKYCGLLSPLDAPHHLRQHNTFMYREGVVTEKKVKDEKSSCYVNVGLFNDVLVDRSLLPGLRVTVRIDDFTQKQNAKRITGVIVSPHEPRLKTGIYWGYTVRIAHTLSNVFTKCPYNDGYDITIGTSDKGTNVHEINSKSLNYKHALIVFGGLKGLETALKHDNKLNFNDPKLLFDHYINVIPTQGSRTIRTEEAILITLSILQDKIKPQNDDINFDFKNLIPQSEDTGKKQYSKINTKNLFNSNDLNRFN